MAIKIKSKISEKKTFTVRQKFETPGDYLCEVTGARFQPEDTSYADRYFIDLTVEQGPDSSIHSSSWAKFKRSTYKNIKTGTGGIFTAKQQEDLDDEAVQIAFAACFGLSRDDAGELAEGGSIEGEFEKCFEDGDQSAVIGKKVVAHVYVNKKGYTNVDLIPVSEYRAGGKSDTKAAKAAPKAAPAKPASKPSFSEAMRAAGYVFHEEDPTYVYHPDRDDSVVELGEFKRSLGY